MELPDTACFWESAWSVCQLPWLRILCWLTMPFSKQFRPKCFLKGKRSCQQVTNECQSFCFLLRGAVVVFSLVSTTIVTCSFEGSKYWPTIFLTASLLWQCSTLRCNLNSEVSLVWNSGQLVQKYNGAPGWWEVLSTCFLRLSRYGHYQVLKWVLNF